MVKYGMVAAVLVLCFSATAFAQQTADTPFQVHFATSLKKQDALHITNTGASNATFCANVYALATSGTMLACCSCSVATNALVTLSLKDDVLENPKPLPKALVLKVIASSGNAGNCNGASVGTGDSLVPGLGIWRGESQFIPSTLSAGELNRLNTQCGSLHATPNICVACRPQ